jgi:GDP-mannose 4,6 dehydratase
VAPAFSARICVSACWPTGRSSPASTISSSAPAAISSACSITFEVIRHDVTFPLYVELDEIYNLACPASPIHYQHDPVQTTKTSVHGAINMLGLAKRLRARILQASTSEVYGDPDIHPQTEDYWGHVNPVGPRSCYDEGKRCAETLFFDYWRADTSCRSRSQGFLTPTVRACIPTTAGWCRTSSSRRCWAATSPFTARDCRPAHSAMSTTSSTAWCG